MQFKSLPGRAALAFLSILAISFSAFAQKVSDKSMKTNIRAIEKAGEKLLRLNPKIYEFNKTGFQFLNAYPGKQYGFIAEELEAVVPEGVKEKSVSFMTGKNQYRNAKIKEIQETALITLLVASFQEQQMEIIQLKSELAQMKERFASLVEK